MFDYFWSKYWESSQDCFHVRTNRTINSRNGNLSKRLQGQTKVDCIQAMYNDIKCAGKFNPPIFHVWITFYFQPLIIQLSPWKCVYPHTSGSRRNHFHNQLLVVEAFLITNIQKYVYFYDFNENVRYNFLFLCFVFSDRQRTCTKRLHCTHIGTIVNKVFGRNRISVTEIVAGSHSQPYQSERSWPWFKRELEGPLERAALAKLDRKIEEHRLKELNSRGTTPRTSVVMSQRTTSLGSKLQSHQLRYPGGRKYSRESSRWDYPN